MHKNLQIVEIINQFDCPKNSIPMFGILKRLRYNAYTVIHALEVK